MRFPSLTSRSKRASTIGEFRGLNQNLIIGDNEWSAMKNISDRFYPAIATRPERGTVDQTIANPKALMYKNGLFYISDTNAYYKGTQRFTVTNTAKQIVGMGAYIVVFPDGIIFNTFTGTVETIGKKYTQSGTITFTPLSTKSAFTKISINGIQNYFAKGDAVEIKGCTNDMFNATKIITEAGANYIVVTGALDAEFTQSSGLTIERHCPELDFVCEKDNRLWGCSSANHEIYSSKLGDPKNWYAYESTGDMAYAVNVGSDGDFTAAVHFSTFVLFFKENSMHILRGDKPANYSLTEKELPGVKKGCDRSVCIIDDTLYYVSRNGVYAFDGAIPQKISDNITGVISDAVACQQDSKLYITCKLDDKQTLLVYDPRTRIWDVENDEMFKFAAYSEGVLHFIDYDNQLTSIYGTRNETIEWFLESGDLNEGLMEQKHISKIMMNLWLALGSELTVYMKFDDEPMWHKKGFIRSTRNKTYTLPIIPKRCGKYRIRIEGKGQFKLLAMSKNVEQGSEINGTLQYQQHR